MNMSLEPFYKNRRGMLAGAAALTVFAPLSMAAFTFAVTATPAVAQSNDNNNNNNNNDSDSDNNYDQDQPAQSTRVPAGSQVKLRLLQHVSSDEAQPGDKVRAEVAGDDKSGIPAGTRFIGTVTDVVPATPKKAGQVTIQFGLPVGPDQPQTPNGTGAPVMSVHLQGTTPRGAGHITGIAAGAGALLGLVRKGKLGDAVEGGAIGAVGGEAVDQSQKRGASDVDIKKGSEVNVHVDRALSLHTIVVPGDY